MHTIKLSVNCLSNFSQTIPFMVTNFSLYEANFSMCMCVCVFILATKNQAARIPCNLLCKYSSSELKLKPLLLLQLHNWKCSLLSSSSLPSGDLYRPLIADMEQVKRFLHPNHITRLNLLLLIFLQWFDFCKCCNCNCNWSWNWSYVGCHFEDKNQYTSKVVESRKHRVGGWFG